MNTQLYPSAHIAELFFPEMTQETKLRILSAGLLISVITGALKPGLFINLR